MLRRHTGWTRGIAWLLAVLISASLLTFPGFASAEAEEPAPAGEELTMMNVVTAPADDPADGPAEEPAEEPAAPAEPEESPARDADPADEPTDDPTNDPSDDPLADPPTEDPTAEPAARYTVSYYLYGSDTLLAEEAVEEGTAPKNVPAAAPDGAPLRVWLDKDGAVVDLTKVAVGAEAAYYGVAAPKLNRDDHIRFIRGKGSGKFEPTASLTRAEAATILYNLLQTAETGPLDTAFSDVASGVWFTPQIRMLTSYGVLNGYPDGSFRPNRPVTRAEFVTMIVKLTGATGSTSGFTDVGDSWARESIEAAVSQGWIFGYEERDGTYTFRPNREITRAEAVIIVNRVLGRTADEYALKNGVGILHYLDVAETDWFYTAVMEASIGHTYTRAGAKETWDEYTVESSGLAPGLYTEGAAYYYIDKNGQPVHMKQGITEAEGRFFYAEAEGYYCTGDLSSKRGVCVFADGTEGALTTGFNLIGRTLFYWDLDAGAARLLQKGLNKIGDKTYYADEAGYVIRNNFGAGVQELGGKYYLSRGRCDIITSGEGYLSANSRPTTIDLKNQTFEYEGNMYFLKSDYSLAHNEWAGYLYFGEDCAYTSGSKTLDAYIYGIEKDIIANNALTKEQKLLKVYYYIRGGEGATWTMGSSPYMYRRLSIGFLRGRYNEQSLDTWYLDRAVWMMTNRYGMCFEWAAIYLYMARRLGFQAYVNVGSVFSTTSKHAWCMIQWDGKWHISDVEIEWGYMAGWYSDQAVYRNLFAQTVSNELFDKYTNPECGVTYWVWTETA